jgi:hypothetical protein
MTPPSPEFYRRHREKYLAYRKEHYDANPEIARGLAKKYRERHGDEIRAKERARYAERKEEMQAKARGKYAKNRQAGIAASVKWQKNNPERVRVSYRVHHLRRWYRMTIDEWNELFESQGKRCAICRCVEHPGKRPWHMDHDHSTGQLRGILCQQCNLMLGHAKDNLETLRAAIAYLRFYTQAVE